MIASRSRMLCSSSTTSTRASGMSGRKRDGEGAADARPALHVDLAPVILDDPMHESQAEAAAARLGGEERLEDLAEIGGRDALAGVVHAQNEATGEDRHRDPKLAALGHRLDRIEAQVPDGLPELLPVDPPRERRGELAHGLQGPGGNLMLQQ